MCALASTLPVARRLGSFEGVAPLHLGVPSLPGVMARVAVATAVFPAPVLAVPPACDSFDLVGGAASASAASDRVQFAELMQQAPPQLVTEDTAAALQRLLERSLGRSAVSPGSAVKDAEALARLGDFLLMAYRQTGAAQLLRALLTLKEAALALVPNTVVRLLDLADALFDLCRHHGDEASARALSLYQAAEQLLGRRMCNAKVVLLLKKFQRRKDGEAYTRACGLSYDELHLQHPRVPTQSWWSPEDPRLPKWVSGLALRRTVRRIRADLDRCRRSAEGNFDDSHNDWFFVGERQRWTGLNLMHSGRGGWQEDYCAESACAASTCRLLRSRLHLDTSLWPRLREEVLQAPAATPAPPMYVNFYALAPGAHIIPHLGNDARLTIHLALEVPPGNASRIRVANVTIGYTHSGQLLVFDDAYEHEVWNDSERTRYVLGITIWHPELLKRLHIPKTIGNEEHGHDGIPRKYHLHWRPPPGREVSPVQSREEERTSGADKYRRGLDQEVCRGRLRCTEVPRSTTGVDVADSWT
mmetsp:Transcript_140932/g.270431  ORF Transcript_140932/g.270431 Transcript_140932/m.270431 type:complete len:530 (-) Transcript_140932:3-1592(-)